MIGVIYCWKHKGNGKRYIGQTINEEKRRIGHLKSANRKTGVISPFHTVLRDEGEESFEYSVLYRVEADTREELKVLLDEKESLFIDMYRSYETDFGYNATRNGKAFSEKTNGNRTIRLKNRNKRVRVNGELVRVKKEKKIAKTKSQLESEQKHIKYENLVSNLCSALGKDMAKIDYEK